MININFFIAWSSFWIQSQYRIVRLWRRYRENMSARPYLFTKDILITGTTDAREFIGAHRDEAWIVTRYCYEIQMRRTLLSHHIIIRQMTQYCSRSKWSRRCCECVEKHWWSRKKYSIRYAEGKLTYKSSTIE